jgi:hypothetical protein
MTIRTSCVVKNLIQVSWFIDFREMKIPLGTSGAEEPGS